MPKRGQILPWRVTFKWLNGVGGVIACTSEDAANAKAEQVRINARNQDTTVEVSVSKR